MSLFNLPSGYGQPFDHHFATSLVDFNYQELVPFMDVELLMALFERQVYIHHGHPSAPFGSTGTSL
jgi:hypothetical protein